MPGFSALPDHPIYHTYTQRLTCPYRNYYDNKKPLNLVPFNFLEVSGAWLINLLGSQSAHSQSHGNSLVWHIPIKVEYPKYLSISSAISSLSILRWSRRNFFSQDSELQAWILDLHDNGYPIREGESDHGIPSSVKTAAQLSHLLTITIFTSSCQHAAVNFSQMDTYGFVPNSPLLMRQPPPTQKGKVTEKDIMHCLPNNDETGFAVLTMFDLTRFFPDVVSNSHHSYFH